MDWLWILGIFVGILIISSVLSAVWKNWRLRSFHLSPTQHKILELWLRQREVSKWMAIHASSAHRGPWESERRTYGEIESELSQLLSTLDEAQRYEVLRAIERVS